jgi:O-antigen/teichoic acid export membrane protein
MAGRGRFPGAHHDTMAEQVGEVARGRTAGDAGGVLASHAVAIGLRYLGAVFIARALTLEDFGRFTLALTIVSVAGIVAVMGVSPGLLPFLARARRGGRPEDVRAVVRGSLSIILVASVAVALAILVGAGPLSEWAFDDRLVRSPLLALAPFVVATALLTWSTTLVQGLASARQQAFLSRVVVGLISIVGFALTWTLGLGLTGVTTTMVAAPVVSIVLALRLVAQRAPGALALVGGGGERVTRSLLRESWPLMGVSTFAFVLGWMDVLMMGAFRSSDEVGIYGACVRLAIAVMVVHEAAGPVFMARLSHLFVDRDWPRIRELYRTTCLWSLWSGVTIAAVLIVWGRELLGVFGPEYAAGAAALAVLAAARGASSIGGMCGRMLAITGRARLNLINQTLLIAINGGLGLLWIPRHGALGAAAGTLISVATINLLQTLQVWLLYRVQPYTWRSAAAMAWTVASGALAWQVRDGMGGAFGWTLPLALFLIAAGGFYLAVGVGEEERAFVRLLRARAPWAR